MHCADMDELISAYADDQATPVQAEAVEGHLLVCGRCQDLLQTHRQTRHLLQLLDNDQWSAPDLRLRIAHALAEGAQPSRKMPARVAGLAAIAALLILSLAALGTHALAPQAAAPIPRIATVPTVATMPARCLRGSARAQARCLGVSPQWLSAIIAEDARTALDDSPATQLPRPLMRPGSPVLRRSAALMKGGGFQDVGGRNYRGLQAI